MPGFVSYLRKKHHSVLRAPLITTNLNIHSYQPTQSTQLGKNPALRRTCVVEEDVQFADAALLNCLEGADDGGVVGRVKSDGRRLLALLQ